MAAHEAYVAELEQSYQEAREACIAKQEAEQEDWREQLREERLKEEEAYEELKWQRRSAKEYEENREWHEFLVQLAQWQLEGYRHE